MSDQEFLVEYIASELREFHPTFQWKAVENQSKNIVELYVTFREKIDDEIQVQDIIGQNNRRGYIQFEEVICFYVPRLSHIYPENYLKSFAFDYDRGIEKGLVDGILKYLHMVVGEGQSQLKDFIERDDIYEFYIEWSDTNLAMTLQTLKDTGRYSTDRLFMEITSEESIIEQFMEEKHDGVERV